MSTSVARRGFLGGLTTLPLVGGGVALLGNPSAVAAPVTDRLLDSYDAWLEYERRSLQWERNRNTDMVHWLHPPFVMQMRRADGTPIDPSRSCDYVPLTEEGGHWHFRGEPPASTRAALVLSTVGCGWEGRQW